jgi:hypothetical protein
MVKGHSFSTALLVAGMMAAQSASAMEVRVDQVVSTVQVDGAAAVNSATTDRLVKKTKQSLEEQAQKTRRHEQERRQQQPQ